MKKIFALLSTCVFSLIILSGVYAQENNAESNIIANVNLVNQVLVKQEGRLFTVGVNIQNKIGTQSGVMYGVQVYQTIDGKKVLVDEFAVLDPLSIKQNEYVYKEFAYPLPTSIGGNIELFAFLKTDKGILLSAAPIQTIDVEVVPVSVEMTNCSVDASTKIFRCTLTNTTSKDQSVVFVTQVKQGGSVFAPVVQSFSPEVIALGSKEKKEITQVVEEKVFLKDAFFETILIDQKDSSLVKRFTLGYAGPTQVRTINNVLIEQTDARNYKVKVISLGQSSVATAKVAISSSKAICATQDIEVNKPIVEAVFQLEKPCDTKFVSVSLLAEDGSVSDVFEVEHKTLFPVQDNTKTALALLGVVLLGFFGYAYFKKYKAETTLKA